MRENLKPINTKFKDAKKNNALGALNSIIWARFENDRGLNYILGRIAPDGRPVVASVTITPKELESHINPRLLISQYLRRARRGVVECLNGYAKELEERQKGRQENKGAPLKTRERNPLKDNGKPRRFAWRRVLDDEGKSLHYQMRKCSMDGTTFEARFQVTTEKLASLINPRLYISDCARRTKKNLSVAVLEYEVSGFAPNGAVELH